MGARVEMAFAINSEYAVFTFSAGHFNIIFLNCSFSLINIDKSQRQAFVKDEI
jgi:hypothetical protein